MKKFCLLLILLLGAGLSVNAESTVNIFVRSLPNADLRLYIDGEEVCDLNGPIAKVQKVPSCSTDLVTSAPCYRILKINKDGEYTFKVAYEYTIPTDGSKKYYDMEKTFTITDGTTYNIHIDFKGIRKKEFTIPKEKDVQKWTKEWDELPTVTYPKEK